MPETETETKTRSERRGAPHASLLPGADEAAEGVVIGNGRPRRREGEPAHAALPTALLAGTRPRRPAQPADVAVQQPQALHASGTQRRAGLAAAKAASGQHQVEQRPTGRDELRTLHAATLRRGAWSGRISSVPTP